MKLKHEEHLDHCPCCSTGDYSELFSKKKSDKRTDLYMGFAYFFFLIFSTFNFYLALFMSFISIITMLYFIIKKEKNLFFRSIFLLLFCVLGIIFAKVI